MPQKSLADVNVEGTKAVIADEAKGSKAVESIDVTARDSNGQQWDFSSNATEEQVKSLMGELRPPVVTGSSTCAALRRLRGFIERKRK